MNTTPKLDYLIDFQHLLADYRLSEESKAVLRRAPVILLNAPSSVGRNTLLGRMVQTGKYYFLISDTTRPPRYNDGVLEQNGGPYWFRAEQEVLADLRQGKYIAPEIIHSQQVSGINVSEFEHAQSQGKIAVGEVEIGGIQAVVADKPDTVAIILLPPSFQEWQRRMSSRTKMAPLEYHRRLQTAIRIFREVLSHDYFRLVINDNLDHAVTEVERLGTGGESNPDLQAKGLALTKTLLRETEQFIQTFDVSM